MLTARLRMRCPSACPISTAYAYNHGIAFCKQGLDGSGKASLSAIGNDIRGVQGVLYLIDLIERSKLDEAERNYDRNDDFEVYDQQTEEKVLASTYIAQDNACRADLLPFDWYVSLMVAGAREHGLDAEYIAILEATETRSDPDTVRSERMLRLIA